MSEVRVQIDGEPALFADAKAAIRFSLGFDGVPARPANSKIVEAMRRSKGLGGFDGAAQAGFIRTIMSDLGPLREAVLIARAAHRLLPCGCGSSCCSGHKKNWIWIEAVAAISSAAGEASCGSRAHSQLRFALVRKIYGQYGSFSQLAAEFECDRDTVSDNYGRIHRWLLGAAAGPNRAATEGVETIAWAQIESALRECGIVG